MNVIKLISAIGQRVTRKRIVTYFDSNTGHGLARDVYEKLDSVVIPLFGTSYIFIFQ